MSASFEGGSIAERVGALLRLVPDFPLPGILFQDITPVLADPALFADAIDAIVAPWRDAGITHVAGIESRGFLLAAPVALALHAGLIPIRKPGKLPWHRVGQDYALEYGTGRLEMHADACTAGARVLLVDDVLATGGTAHAACELIESTGGVVAGCAFLLVLASLRGEEVLRNRMIRSVVHR